jgi:hypothetical protein
MKSEQLKRILTENSGTSHKNYTQQVPPIPRDNEKGFRLLDVKKFFLDWDDIVLAKETEEILRQIVKKLEEEEVLVTYGLGPRQKILFRSTSMRNLTYILGDNFDIGCGSDNGSGTGSGGYFASGGYFGDGAGNYSGSGVGFGVGFGDGSGSYDGSGDGSGDASGFGSSLGLDSGDGSGFASGFGSSLGSDSGSSDGS